MEIAIKSPYDQHHPVGQQGLRVQKAPGIEAARGRPSPARRIRWRLDIRSSLADILLTSLAQCAGQHLDNEKQQNEEKRAPTEMRHKGTGSSFIHSDCPSVFA